MPDLFAMDPIIMPEWHKVAFVRGHDGDLIVMGVDRRGEITSYEFTTPFSRSELQSKVGVYAPDEAKSLVACGWERLY